MTRLDSSVGMPSRPRESAETSMLQMGCASSASSTQKSSVSISETVWNREASSWKPSSRLRKMRRKRLIFDGATRLSAGGSFPNLSLTRSTTSASATDASGEMARAIKRDDDGARLDKNAPLAARGERSSRTE